MQRQTFFFAPPPGEGSKGQISFNFNYKVNFKIPNFVCVLTNERYKTYQTGFSFCPLDHARGVGLWGRLGCPGGQIIFLIKHGHVVYQIEGDKEQNRMQVKFSS